MKKKIMKLFLSSSTGLIILALIIFVPILMVMDFFGANITDGYVENNSEYAEEYRSVATKYIKSNQGYVSLERILYFYLADSSLSFDEIYKNNLDTETKKMIPISEACTLDKFKVLNVCSSDSLSTSKQVNEEQAKPFTSPIDFSKTTLTSFFMEERVVYGKANVHKAWDIASPAQTPVYSVCDGTVDKVSFPYSTNSIDTSDKQGGNIISLSCEIGDITYKVLYGHLFPNSAKVKTGDTVSKGQTIAGVGTTGYSTGNHLHYQVSLNDKVVDGMSLIDFNNKSNSDSTILKPYNQETLPSYTN